MNEQFSPTDYRGWMRERFPKLNKNIDDGNAGELCALSNEIIVNIEAIANDSASGEREQFTYISMIYAALYHHRNVAQTLVCKEFEEALGKVEPILIRMASELGVERRFLSAFYLFHNPEIPEMNGKFAQFRPSEYETAFLRINREGTLQYKQAALSLRLAAEMLATGNSSLNESGECFDNAAKAFRQISHGNAMLMRTSGSEEFRFLTKYFGEVRVAGGPPLRGVNAGDQPWSYIIDLLLGVDLKHAFETAFHGTPNERHYPAYVRTSADAIYFELKSREYLRDNYFLPEDYEALKVTLDDIGHGVKALPDSIPEIPSLEDRSTLSKKLLSVLKNYIGASNVHFQLAKRFVPQNPLGEQIGSAGTNIRKFLLHGLNDERVKVQSLLEKQYPEFVEQNQNLEQANA